MDGDLPGTLTSTLCTGIFILSFAGLGIYLIVRLVRDFYQAGESKKWIAISGEVISSGVDIHKEVDDEGAVTTTFRATVTYRYIIGDQIYQNDQIAFNSNLHSSNYKEQAEVSGKYLPGKTITVYYNPKNPAESVLERRVRSVFATILMASVFLVIALVILLSMLRAHIVDFFVRIFGG